MNWISRHYFPFLFMIFLCLGFLGNIYYMEHEGLLQKQPHYSTEEILRARALTHRLNRLEYQNAHLESMIAELNLKTAELYEQESFSKIQQLARYTGQIQQEGPGIEVVMNDSAKPFLLGENPNTGIVHNTDLLGVVNELHAAGARAVAVNRQPVTSMTAISCSGPIILINKSRISPPFSIQALGDPERMDEVLNRSTGLLHELKSYGISVSIKKKDVVIPASSQEIANLS